MIKAAAEFDYPSRLKEDVTSCNLCGGKEFKTLANVDRYGLPLRNVYCETCGLVFVTPRLQRESLAELYSNHYRRLVDEWSEVQTGKPSAPLHCRQAKLNYAACVGQAWHKQLEVYRGCRAVDLGGSTGEVSRMLRDNFSIDCTVVDPSPSEVAEAKAEYEVDGVVSLAEDWNPDGSYDLIFCLQTLEHLADPMAVLKKIRSVANGLVFVDIVDFGEMFQHVGENCCKVDHCYSFVHDTACAILARAGLRVWKHSQITQKPSRFYVCIPDDVKPNALPGPAALYHLINGVYKCRASWVNSAWNELPTSSKSRSRSPTSKPIPV